MMANHVGEVIESSTRGFVARSQNVGESPHFGYFVKTKGEPVVYGVVYEILTESKEPGRKPTTYGMSIEELRREQPQIFELLKTEFHALIIAYSEQGKTRFSLPPPTASDLFVCLRVRERRNRKAYIPGFFSKVHNFISKYSCRRPYYCVPPLCPGFTGI